MDKAQIIILLVWAICSILAYAQANSFIHENMKLQNPPAEKAVRIAARIWFPIMGLVGLIIIWFLTEEFAYCHKLRFRI